MFGYQILGFGSGGVAPTIEGLVVAGGGSGGSGISGWNNGGAGGAGGYRTFVAPYPGAGQTITVTVCSGGSAPSVTGGQKNNGQSSEIS